MVRLPDHLYRDWRQEAGAALELRESRRTGSPPERWLQEIWHHQRIRRQELVTVDGVRLVVLHPGFWNREAGPDFTGAVIQLGDAAPVTGDIEIDLQASGWKAHAHIDNPAYQRVILHVVWEGGSSGDVLPTLVLRDVLDSPIDELGTWVGGAGEIESRWLRGECSGPLRNLAVEVREALLRQAALVRLQTKALLFSARARQVGWSQALWEGAFRGLGYKHNAWPMQRLAELLPELQRRPFIGADPRFAWEARLLGLAGFLPAEAQAGTRARRAWDLWWREREALYPSAIPRTLWRLNGVRPANHPQRRLALGAAWLADADWQQRLEEWFMRADQIDHPQHELLRLLGGAPDRFWRQHYTLTTRHRGAELGVLGAGRVNELAVNAILPWFWARAQAGAQTELRARTESVYLAWPAGEDNATLKLARARVLGGDMAGRTRSAAMQQGLLQIVRDFCSYSNALCEQCQFPALVDALRASSPERQV